MSPFHTRAATEVVHAIGSGSPWAAHRFILERAEGLVSKTGVTLAGEAKRRLDYWLGWAVEELSEGSTGEARSSLVDARCVQLEAEQALETTLAAARAIPHLSELSLAAWTRDSVVYEGRHPRFRACVLKLARPAAVAEGRERRIYDPDSGEVVCVPPSDLLDASLTAHRRLAEHTEIFPRSFEDGTALGLRYVLMERLPGLPLRDTIRRRSAVDAEVFVVLIEELAHLRREGFFESHFGLVPDRLFLYEGRVRALPPLPRGSYGGRAFVVCSPRHAPHGTGNDAFSLLASRLEATAPGASLLFHPWLERSPARWTLSPEVARTVEEAAPDLPWRSLARVVFGGGERARLLATLGLRADDRTLHAGPVLTLVELAPPRAAEPDRVVGPSARLDPVDVYPSLPLRSATFAQADERLGFTGTEGESPLERWYERIRNTPVSELDDEDLARAVRQSVHLPLSVFIATGRLRSDPLLGALYDGELVASFERLPVEFLRTWPGLRRDVHEVANRLVQLRTLTTFGGSSLRILPQVVALAHATVQRCDEVATSPPASVTTPKEGHFSRSAADGRSELGPPPRVSQPATPGTMRTGAIVLADRYRLRVLPSAGPPATLDGVDVTRDQPVRVIAYLNGPEASRAHAEWILREGELVHSLDHDNIVRVLHVERGRPDGAYVVTEHLGGPRLSDLIAENGRLTDEEVLRFAIPICDALGAVHGRGALYRNLKPSKIRLAHVSGHPSAKLCLSGISWAPGWPRVQDGAVIGTSGYMAPEQCSAAPIDACADIWAMGCVLLEALTGLPAFTNDRSRFMMAMLTRTTPPRGLDQVRGPLQQTIERCLRWDPSERFESMATLARSLRAQPPGTLPA